MFVLYNIRDISDYKGSEKRNASPQARITCACALPMHIPTEPVYNICLAPQAIRWVLHIYALRSFWSDSWRRGTYCGCCALIAMEHVPVPGR